MRVLWSSPQPRTVRDVFEVLAAERQLAYTTVMTVLDRLAKKGTVMREQRGRAWSYRPAATEAELIVAEMRSLLEGAGQEANLVLAQLVDVLDRDQRAHLERVLKALPAR